MSPLFTFALLSFLVVLGETVIQNVGGFQNGTAVYKFNNGSKFEPGELDNCTGSTSSEAQPRRSSTPAGKAIPVVFGPLPKGRDYATAAPRDTTAVNPYQYIKGILNFIHPYPFQPDLFRDMMRGNISSPATVLKVLEMEMGYIFLFLLSLFLSLAVPGMVLSLCSADPTPPPSCAPDCKRRTLVFCLQLLLSLLLLGSLAMLWTNEECSRGIASGPQFSSDLLRDAKQFFEESTHQLQHLLTDSFEQAVAPISHDLNDAENLLGRPMQVELILETGLDTALDSLVEIAAGGKEVCSQLASILRSTVETEQLIVFLESKLHELREQIQVVKRRCQPTDRPLCDLIPDQLIDVKFTTKMITNNSRLVYLKQSKIDTLSSSVLEANAIFTGLPTKIEKETKSTRMAVINEVMKKKADLMSAASSLDVIKTRTNIALYDLKATSMPKLDQLLQFEYWRWLVGLGLLILYIWALMTGATCCGCCGAENNSSPTLIITLILTAIVSVCLWMFSSMTVYIGGHGESCVCRTMREENFDDLSKFVDTIMSTDVDEESYLSYVIHRNGSLPLPIGNILSECKKNVSSYSAFNLKTMLDIEELVNLTKWHFVYKGLEEIKIDLANMHFFDPKMIFRLVDLQQGLLVNLTTFRTKMMGPISTDLDSVVTQLQGVAKQTNDRITSNQLKSLAVKSKNLISPILGELENHKENMVFHLTALELKVNPLLQQVNHSLSHTKAVQYYIANHGSSIAQHNIKTFTARIENYLEQYQKFVLNIIRGNKTSCYKFWEIFESLRAHVCRRTIDPLNGFWFSTVWCLLILIFITPICLKLIEYYNQNSDLNPALNRTSSEGDWANTSLPEENW
ncbi:prominin-2 isoform X2 [Cimex lectularius]|uniref:Prominin n=1 Tax=Cimex lectularius TaxID=79782 RepID=A0A8I6SKX9_CIMLE|nr:prominin-2 isoform X2 [Cimex lectularius]